MSMIKYGISRISTQAREGKSLRQHNSNDIEAIVCWDDNWTMYEIAMLVR